MYSTEDAHHNSRRQDTDSRMLSKEMLFKKSTWRWQHLPHCYAANYNGVVPEHVIPQCTCRMVEQPRRLHTLPKIGDVTPPAYSPGYRRNDGNGRTNPLRHVLGSTDDTLTEMYSEDMRSDTDSSEPQTSIPLNGRSLPNPPTPYPTSSWLYTSDDSQPSEWDDSYQQSTCEYSADQYSSYPSEQKIPWTPPPSFESCEKFMGMYESSQPAIKSGYLEDQWPVKYPAYLSSTTLRHRSVGGHGKVARYEDQNKAKPSLQLHQMLKLAADRLQAESQCDSTTTQSSCQHTQASFDWLSKGINRLMIGPSPGEPVPQKTPFLPYIRLKRRRKTKATVLVPPFHTCRYIRPVRPQQ